MSRLSSIELTWKQVGVIVLAVIMIFATMYGAMGYAGGKILVDDHPSSINLQGDPALDLKIRYVDTYSTPLSASMKRVDVSDKNDKVIKSYNLIETTKGVYYVQIDFSNYESDPYKIWVHLDDNLQLIPMEVVSYPPVLGMFYNEQGMVRQDRVVGGIIVLFIVAIFLIIIAMTIFKKRGAKKNG